MWSRLFNVVAAARRPLGRDWPQRAARRFLSTPAKDISLAKSTSSPDILLQNLKSAADTDAVLGTVAAHHKVMNAKHLTQALRYLFILQKTGNTKYSTEELLQHPDFKLLCGKIKRSIRSIDAPDAIDAIKVLSYVRVPGNSLIVQSLLQMVRYSVNDLPLHNIIFLDFILKRLESSPLSEALAIALPIVFDAQLRFKLDRSSLQQVVDCLHFVARKAHISASSRGLLISAAEAFDRIDARSAYSILWSLADMDADEGSDSLVRRCLRILAENGDQFNHAELELILGKLVAKYCAGNTAYYHQHVFELCADKVVEEDAGLQQAIYVLRKYVQAGFQSALLMDYIDATICEDETKLSEATTANLITVLLGMAQTHYRTRHFDTMKQAIEANEVTNRAGKDFSWIKFATRLAILDIYQPEVLKMAFQASKIETLAKNGSRTDLTNFLLLYQAVAVLRSDLADLLPDINLVADIVDRVHLNQEEYPLRGALEKSLGGAIYVNSGVKTRIGQHLDHVILMREGGYPVAHQMKDKLFDLDGIPEKSQILAVLMMGPQCYTINTKRLLGHHKLFFNVLEAMGICVVPICEERWTCLADFEKIPFLMQAIRSRTEHNREKTLLET